MGTENPCSQVIVINFAKTVYYTPAPRLSRQAGSRNMTGPKTLPTIWYTYMTLVTKYQISAINSY
jgi:hypothetical protein